MVEVDRAYGSILRNLPKDLLGMYTVEEILEYYDIDVEELVDYLYEIGWIDDRPVPLEVNFNNG